MTDLKYINFKQLGIVIFDHLVDHSVLAARIADEPLSAGFVRIPNKDEAGNEIKCYGKSVSLNIKADERDTDMLRRRINPYHW